ncbi:MAG: ABC transporter permease subunit [Candidatus Fermentibacteria bacterium]|nr:ABC transporter permease subunit [Candidatus Fermentibacteria bacterium]
MWKKEITDTLKQTARVLSFLLIIPLVYGVNQFRLEENMTFFVYTLWGLTFILPILSFILAYTMFASDDSEGAAEYLRSLPVSRWKLLAVKILPRFILFILLMFFCRKVLATFWFGAGISSVWSAFGVEGFLKNTLIVLTVMAGGFVLGISNRKNPFLILCLLVPVVFLYATLSPYGSILSSKLIWVYYFNFMEPLGIEQLWVFNLGRFLTYMIGTALPGVLPILVLIPVYRSWDCSSGKVRSERIMKRMAIPLGFIIALYATSELKLF